MAAGQKFRTSGQSRVLMPRPDGAPILRLVDLVRELVTLVWHRGAAGVGPANSGDPWAIWLSIYSCL